MVLIFKVLLCLALIFLNFLISPSIAQTDSTEIDTIYIKEPPIIIKKEVYLPYEDTVAKTSYFLSAGLGVGKNLSTIKTNSSKTIYDPYANPLFIIGASRKNWSIGIGLSYLRFSGSISINRKTYSEKERNFIITDTIDIYTETIDGEKKYYYVTEERDTVAKYIEVGDTSLAKKMIFSFLQVPIQIRYKLQKGKWILSPSLSLQPTLLLNHNANEDSPRKLFLLLGSVGIGVGREFAKNLSAEIFAEAIKEMIGTKQKPSHDLFLLAAGLRLNYKF